MRPGNEQRSKKEENKTVSEIKKMNPEQMEEVTGGTDHGRLIRGEIAAVDFCIKLTKSQGKTIDYYLEALRKSNSDPEFYEAAEKYARTFWDRLSF